MVKQAADILKVRFKYWYTQNVYTMPVDLSYSHHLSSLMTNAELWSGHAFYLIATLTFVLKPRTIVLINISKSSDMLHEFVLVKCNISTFLFSSTKPEFWTEILLTCGFCINFSNICFTVSNLWISHHGVLCFRNKYFPKILKQNRLGSYK